MMECIRCGSVSLSGVTCKKCGGALIPALEEEHAQKEYVTQLSKLGIEFPADKVRELSTIIC